MANAPGPEVVTNILTGNKGMLAALAIILLAIFFLMWLKQINDRLRDLR